MVESGVKLRMSDPRVYAPNKDAVLETSIVYTSGRGRMFVGLPKGKRKSLPKST